MANPDREQSQTDDDIGVRGESTPATACADLALVFDSANGDLMANIVSADAPARLDLDELRARLDAEGYGEFSFQADALKGVLRRLQTADFGEYLIARRVDAEVSVGMTADRLQGLLTTTRAYGGAAVTEERIRRAMTEAGILEDFRLQEAIDEALARDSVTNAVVARGTLPQAGQDSRAEVLVDLEGEVRHPRENEQGRVDHYLSREFVIVEAETPLLRFHPATAGRPGRDITGKAVPARDGKTTPLPRDAPGVRPHADDENLIVADYKGHPVVITGGIRVDKTLVMDYVDLRTGNVDFDGSVLVKGDATAGVLVKATGDIHIKGSAENASLEAGGDVHVSRGITGAEGAMNGGPRTVHVEARRDVHAAFAGGVRLVAGQDVVVKEYLSHCETQAGNRVLVGQPGGRGLIVGGECHGTHGVVARLAGTVATVPTRIGAGARDQVREARQQAEETAATLTDQLRQLRTALTGMVKRAKSGGEKVRGMVEKVRTAVEEIERQADRNDRRLAELEGELAATGAATVSISGPVHPGVTIQVGEAALTVRNQASGGRFSCRDGEIIWD